MGGKSLIILVVVAFLLGILWGYAWGKRSAGGYEAGINDGAFQAEADFAADLGFTDYEEAIPPEELEGSVYQSLGDYYEPYYPYYPYGY